MENNEEKQEIQQLEINPVEEYVKKLNDEREKMISSNPVENEQKPDFLLPQFKNIEEQAKSYKELQALQTKQAQELAQFKKEKELNEQKVDVQQQMNIIKKQEQIAKQNLNDMYLREMENLKMALKYGKISEKEAMNFVAQLRNFTVQKMQNLDFKYKDAYSKCGKNFDMISPKEYFQEDLLTKNYLSPICEFLEVNYKKMPKNELLGVKNLVDNLETSLRDEILNENRLAQENELYRQNLSSTTNLNPQTSAEKIYTLEEIKKMKPEEFRKNQQTILEQFTSRKIK